MKPPNQKRAETEFVTFLDKIVVFYESEDQSLCLWRVVPRAEIDRIDQSRYLFYVHWSFDAYIHFLGNRVRDKLTLIFDKIIYLAAKVSSHYHLSVWDNQRKASIRAIRRRAIKLMRRYYKGSFITKKFKQLLNSFVSAIGNNITVALRHKLNGQVIPAVEYSC